MMSDFGGEGGLGGSSKIGQSGTRVEGTLEEIGRPIFQKVLLLFY